MPRRATANAPDFDLVQFFPYRVAVLAERVSQAISQVYLDRFELSRAEWRVLAALGCNERMAARDIGPYSALDKMQVSRAVARLEQEKLIRRVGDKQDGRAKIISLTAAGETLYRRIVPLVLAREAYLLETLEPGERAILRRAMDRLLARAEGLIERG